MTKYEFLGDLSRLLADLPEEERKQAMHYYANYSPKRSGGWECYSQNILSWIERHTSVENDKRMKGNI